MNLSWQELKCKAVELYEGFLYGLEELNLSTIKDI